MRSAGFARLSQKFGNGNRTLNCLGSGQNYGLEEIAHNWRNAGAPVPLQLGPGGLISDTFGRPLDVNGDPVRGLFTFGLGSGFPSGGQFGSEAAFRGRIYGVWIFHHDIGGMVLQGVLEELATIAGTSEAESTVTVVERGFARLHRT